MKLNLKEKIFNLLARKFFGLNYNFSEAKDFNLTKIMIQISHIEIILVQ